MQHILQTVCNIIEQGWFAPAKSSLFNAEKCKHSKEKGDSSPSPGTVAASNTGIAIGPGSRDQYGSIQRITMPHILQTVCNIIKHGWFAPAKSSLFKAEQSIHSKEIGDSSPSPGTVAASNPGIAIGPCSRDHYGKIWRFCIAPYKDVHMSCSKNYWKDNHCIDLKNIKIVSIFFAEGVWLPESITHSDVTFKDFNAQNEMFKDV